MRSSFLMDLLSSIFERGERRYAIKDNRSLEALFEALLSERGEASGMRISAILLDHYEALDREGQVNFFGQLTDRYDIDAKSVCDAAQAYLVNGDAETLGRLQELAEPRRQEILRRLNRLPGATGRLVQMRADLIDLLTEHPDFRRSDIDFEHLFGSWFNRGFLVLRQIDWTTPAHILEKIIEYEAVHAIGDWDDLRRRLQPADRRCFAFFHPAMPDDPLIFVEIALSTEIPGSIGAVLSEERNILEDRDATTAVFYSISNCQKGLAGVSFGNFLIKQVAADLGASLPNLKTFVTLSPMPGFARWLNAEAAEGRKITNAELDEISEHYATDQPVQNKSIAEMIERLAADYLVNAKRPDGQPLDPVARFHLGNGARLEHIRPGADDSSKGMQESFGVMVNYLYDLSKVEENHESYAQDRRVVARKSILTLASASLRAKTTRSAENAQHTV